MLGFTGDWMPAGGRVIRFGDRLRDFLKPADFLVANFEGISVRPHRAVVMQQVHGPETLEALTRLAPPDRIIVSVANNHAADHGFKVFLSHLRTLEARGFLVVGDCDRPVVVPVPGVRLAALTRWSNHPAPFLASLDRENALACPGDFCIMYPHWGFELELYPRMELVQQAREWLGRWDLVVGHHSHTPAPVSAIETPGGKRPVAFSLGNFMAGSWSRKNRWGMVVRIHLGRDPGGRYRLRRLDWRFTTVTRNRREFLLRLSDHCPYFPEVSGD